MSGQDPADPLDAALAVARVFEARQIAYALGGALAYGLWGIPRATIDVDFNIFVEQSEIGRVTAALEELSIVVDLDRATQQNAERGMFQVQFGHFRVDLFMPSIDFSWEAKRTRARQKIEGQEIWVLSAEALSVFKLLFFRAKDLVDLERLVAVQGDRLDVEYVREQISKMMGEDDERVAAWDQICSSGNQVQ